MPGTNAAASWSAPMLPGAAEIGGPEHNAVLAALDPAYIAAAATGTLPESASWIRRFERGFAAMADTRYATATNSGTSALYAAFMALDISPGDEVIIPAYGFIACAAAVLAVGAIPVITDVDTTLTLDPVAVRRNMSAHTRAILAVHMRGMPANLHALQGIAAEYGVYLVEDAAQACGASYAGRPVGGQGTLGCFGFHPTKTITADQGGIVVTNDATLSARVTCAANSEWIAPQDEPGFDRPFTGLNLTMSHISAALATAQLDRLPGLVSRMRERADILNAELARSNHFQLRATPEHAAGTGNCVIFYAPSPAIALAVRHSLREGGIAAHVLYAEGEQNWRVFRCWTDVLAKRGRGPDNFPWSAARREITYPTGICSATIDLLTRAVHIDVNPLMSLDETQQLAARLARLTPTGLR